MASFKVLSNLQIAMGRILWEYRTRTRGDFSSKNSRIVALLPEIRQQSPLAADESQRLRLFAEQLTSGES